MSCLANSHSSSKTGLRYHLLQKAFLIATCHIVLMCEPTAPCNPSYHCPYPTAWWPPVSFTPGLTLKSRGTES